MTTNVIYPAHTPADARRAVETTLYQSMRWMFWYEIADRLRYVGITARRIDRALDELVASARIDHALAGDGRDIWRIRF